MTFPILKRPIGYQWVILLSLVFFSFFPIFVLEIVHLTTLPQNIESDQLDKSESQLLFAADRIQQSLASDASLLAILSRADQIRSFFDDDTNNSLRDVVVTEFQNFISESLGSPLSPVFTESHRILEIGIDLIDSYSVSSSDFSGDQLVRLLTLPYDPSTSIYITQGRQEVLEIHNYYPFHQIKSFSLTKTSFSSSIRQQINFMTGEAIRGEDQSPLPVNVHSQIIQAENGTWVGHIYTVVSAKWILEAVDALSKPAILTNQAGTVFYSDDVLRFTEVTGYYKSILDAPFNTTLVDRNGYQGEITIYRQIAIDTDQNETLLIAKVLPRSEILESFSQALIQAFITVIVFTSFATLLAYFTTRSLTQRIRQVTKAADQVSKGDFEVNLDLEGTDELAKLTRSFHQMTKQLKIHLKDEDTD